MKICYCYHRLDGHCCSHKEKLVKLHLSHQFMLSNHFYIKLFKFFRQIVAVLGICFRCCLNVLGEAESTLHTTALLLRIRSYVAALQ